jgi:hypothetical protein
VAADREKLDRLLVDVFMESYPRAPREIWLDPDGTDDPLHGHKESRFLHGYYRCYCCLPLYIRCRTRKSWSCERRVVGKAEYLPGKAWPPVCGHQPAGEPRRRPAIV